MDKDKEKIIKEVIKYIEETNKFIVGCDINLITDWQFVVEKLKKVIDNK